MIVTLNAGYSISRAKKMNPDKPLNGGIPMIKIDGAKIRRLREQQGLTQLYIATVVEVTTDTISRWENKRYPSIKKENAIKLSQALEVPLDTILDLGEKELTARQNTHQDAPQQEPTEGQVTPLRIFSKKYIGLFLLILVLAVVSIWPVKKWLDKPVNIADQLIISRTLPSHVPPGVPFPVMVEITSDYPEPFSFILKESLPSNARAIQGNPLYLQQKNTKGTLRWISKLTGDYAVFTYLAQPDKNIELGNTLQFNGKITCKKENKMTTSISGDRFIKIDFYHWADTNSDGKIDDEEILSVYDTYGAIDGLNFDREVIEQIWSGKGYRWNPQTRQYEIEF